jgi:sugar-specific transcriptional regulator TrmB
LEVPEKHLETLKNLGLTLCQAKVYLAVVQIGTSKAKKISEVTSIARPYVYVIIRELEKLGLIEKMISNHGTKAIPLHAGISYLVRRKKQETQQLAQKAQNMLRNFEKLDNTTKAQDYTSQFVWLSEGEPYIRKQLEEVNNAQNSIDFVTTWKRFPHTTFISGEPAKKALRRKVKMRVVMEKPPKRRPLPHVITNLKKYRNYYLRYIPNPPLTVIAIFDQKKIIIDVSSSAGPAECPALWSNNPSLLAAMQSYYENLWCPSNGKAAIQY